MFSLVTSRIASRLPTSHFSVGFARAIVVPRASGTVSLSQTRRTLITTPRLELPTKAKSKATTTKKPAAKKASTKKPVKGGVAAKPTGTKRSPVKRKAGRKVVPKPKPEKIVITQDMKPPRKSPGPYMLYFVKRLEGLPKATSREEMLAPVKACAAAWKELSDSEKKPFYDQNNALKEEYHKKIAEWFKNVDPKVLRLLNKRRVAKGKAKLRPPRPAPEDRMPLTGFIRFSQEFRNSPDGQRIKAGNVQAIPLLGARAGQLWRAMSDAEKEPYNTEYHKDLAAYKAKRLGA